MASRLMRLLLVTAIGFFFFGTAPVFAKGEKCNVAKTSADCGKKAGCSWNGKVCAPGKAAKAAKPAKADKKAAAKPAKADKKAAKAGKKPAETPAAAPAAPAEAAPAAAEEAPAEDMPPPEGESEEDF